MSPSPTPHDDDKDDDNDSDDNSTSAVGGPSSTPPSEGQVLGASSLAATGTQDELLAMIGSAVGLMIAAVSGRAYLKTR